jgi:hypothetical protein
MGTARNLANFKPSSAGLAGVEDLDTSATQLFGSRNKFINGGFDIWQRGTTINASGEMYLCDRWKTMGQTFTATRSTDVPNSDAQYSLDISSAVNSYGTFGQRIESANCFDLVGKSITISFWAKRISATFPEINVHISFANSADNFSSVTVIDAPRIATNLSNSWTYYTVTFNNLPSGVANGLQVMLYNNSLVAHQIRFALFQLEKGSIATPFERREIGAELALCQRYFEKQYEMSVVPGTNMGNDQKSFFTGLSGSASIKYSNSHAFKVSKRASPTMAYWNYQGTSGSWMTGAAGQTETSTAVTGSIVNENAIGTVYFTTGNNWAYGFWTANAEL